MDGDPAVENELDSFSRTFPLPYRVAFIIIFAVWGWGMNLHYLHSIKIDVPQLIRYPGRSNAKEPPHHASTYRLATVLSIASGLSLVTFWLFTRRDPDLVLAYDWMPMLNLLVLAALFVIPLRRFAVSHSGRGRVMATLRRISVGGLAQATEGKFGDILLADAMTSYAKVLADLFVCICMFFTHNHSATARPDRNCGGTVVIPLIMAVPYAIRLRQCLIEFVRVRNAPRRESSGWGGQHLANALKYFTSFPVIVLSALMRSLPTADESAGGSQQKAVGTVLYRAWVVAILINSLYSFYWDVAKDWDLTMFNAVLGDSSRERHQGYPFGLRPRLMIHQPIVYYVVIGLDLVLRCTWSLKLSPHLDHIADFESSIFLIQFLEVLRRWVWIFFRVETEWIRNTASVGLGVDDILLGDFQGQGKYEDDDED